MAWRPHGRARVSSRDPRAFAVCDRCSLFYNLRDLKWQTQWSGSQLQNLRILVCQRCLDVPQQQLRSLILPPDPVPVFNARPENFDEDNNDYRITQDDEFRITEDDEFRVTQETGDDLGGGGEVRLVTKRQIVLALIDPSNPSGANAYPVVVNSIDPLGGDDGSAEWLSNSPMSANDPLYILIQTANGWTSVQMTGFFALARSMPA